MASAAPTQAEDIFWSNEPTTRRYRAEGNVLHGDFRAVVKSLPSAAELGYNTDSLTFHEDEEPREGAIREELEKEFNRFARLTVETAPIDPLKREECLEEILKVCARYRLDDFNGVSRSDAGPPAEQDGLVLPAKAEVLYVNRPDRDMDPITFLDTYWGRYIQAGILYQDDLASRLDPQLIPNVRSYCQRMAKKHPNRAAEFVAKDHLPPVRPKDESRQALLDVAPGTAEYEVERRRAYQRERQAKYRENARKSANLG